MNAQGFKAVAKLAQSKKARRTVATGSDVAPPVGSGPARQPQRPARPTPTSGDSQRPETPEEARRQQEANARRRAQNRARRGT